MRAAAAGVKIPSGAGSLRGLFSSGAAMEEDQARAGPPVWEKTPPDDRRKHPAHEFFRKFAHRSSAVLGSFWAFIAAVLVVVAWLVTGPLFGFSDSWQLVINTGTTIV